MDFIWEVESWFTVAVHTAIIIIELIGVIILLKAAVKSAVGYFRHSHHVRLMLAQGIAFALQFKLGGEVLRTVIAREMNELLMLTAVVILRLVMTLLIHWEIKDEESKLADLD